MDFCEQSCNGTYGEKLVLPEFRRSCRIILLWKIFSVWTFGHKKLSCFLISHLFMQIQFALATRHQEYDTTGKYLIYPRICPELIYGILKKLPSVHHFLATLYYKLLTVSQVPPSGAPLPSPPFIIKRETVTILQTFAWLHSQLSLGRLFFHQILASHSTDYLTSNNLIDSFIQKTCIQGINCVITHNQVFNELVSQAKSTTVFFISLLSILKRPLALSTTI